MSQEQINAFQRIIVNQAAKLMDAEQALEQYKAALANSQAQAAERGKRIAELEAKLAAPVAGEPADGPNG